MRRRLAFVVLLVLMVACSGGGPRTRSTPSPSAAPVSSRPSAEATPPGTLAVAAGFEPDAVAFWTRDLGLLAGNVAAPASPLPGCPGGCRGIVALSSDGGRTWRVAFRTAGTVLDLSTLGDRFAWASVYPCSASGVCQAQMIVRTEDGGSTWSELPARGIHAPSFATPSLGWGIRSGSSSRDAELARTSDEGATWRSLPQPCPYSLDAQDVALASPSRGWVLCTGVSGAGQQPKAVLASADGGQTWKATASVGIGASSPAPPGGLVGYGYAQGLTFLPDGHGWLWENFRGFTYATTDGGHTWRSLDELKAETTAGLSLSFTSDADGYLLEEGGGVRLLHTSDGGRAWQLRHSWPPRVP